MAGELSPQQINFLAYYTNPTSETFSNALQSALKAGYKQEYAENITALMPNWLSENIGRRKRMLSKAEKKLDELIDSDDVRVSADVSKFIAKTIGKDEGYSDRTEHTGKNGESLSISIVNYADNNSLPIHSEDLPDSDI